MEDISVMLKLLLVPYIDAGVPTIIVAVVRYLTRC